MQLDADVEAHRISKPIFGGENNAEGICQTGSFVYHGCRHVSSQSELISLISPGGVQDYGSSSRVHIGDSPSPFQVSYWFWDPSSNKSNKYTN